MDINKFCVNDKVYGSCWGRLVTFDILEDLISYEKYRIEFQKRLYEWNGKIYLWFKNISNNLDGITGDNFFVEIEA